MLEVCLNTLIHKDHSEDLPVVIDLFSGCGGLSVGFRSEGFEVAGGIEFEQHAVNTVSYNIHGRYGEEYNHICGDITKHSPDIFKNAIKKRNVITIGGPPCQAYSRIGQAKLRSLGPERINTKDSRGYLYQDFLRYSLELDSDVIVMENVPESTNFGKLNIPQHVSEILENHGYKALWTILNAADYGVPQTRERVFVIAVKEDSEYELNLPTPTHISVDYDREVYMNQYNRYTHCKNFRVPNQPKGNESKWVTVREALSDLPSLFKDASQKYRFHAIKVQKDYRTPPQNNYQRLMRSWYGYDTVKVTGHCFRKNTRDFPIFEKMKPGDNFIDASFIADNLLQDVCLSLNIDEHSDTDQYNELKRKIVPPYCRKNFISKWKRLDPDRPSHTLVAHLSVDTYSHIHPWEPRGISVREAARLQSFPDDFIFQGPMGASFKQIGNAVPPLLSRAIAKAIKESIK